MTAPHLTATLKTITTTHANIASVRTALSRLPERMGLTDDYLRDAELAIANALQEIREWIADAEEAQAQARADAEGDTIRVLFARKQLNLEQVLQYIAPWEEGSVPEATRVKIIEQKSLTPEEYDTFVSDFFVDHDWLAGKGGTTGKMVLAIEVVCPGRQTLYVDPSGHNYARYVGIAA